MNVDNVCCFTGHRFENVPEMENKIKPLLENTIDNAIENGYTTFISGMALGTDVWAAEIMIERKKINNVLKLMCALPYPNFERNRTDEEKDRYNRILDNADAVIEISQHYFRGCYQKRNTWMVEKSSLIVAVYNGESGGTKNTVDYAERKGKKIENVLE